jgi:hypothetical protein
VIWRSDFGRKHYAPPPQIQVPHVVLQVSFVTPLNCCGVSSVICSLSVQQYLRQLWFRCFILGTGTIFFQILLNHNCRLVVRCDIYHRKFKHSAPKLFAVKNMHVSIIRNIKISNIQNNYMKLILLGYMVTVYSYTAIANVQTISIVMS